MTPEEAFEKWLDSRELFPAESYKHWLPVFLAGIQFQENQQLLCLVQIREALGDKEAKLSQEELVERVKGLANPWLPIETAPLGEYVLACDDAGGVDSGTRIQGDFFLTNHNSYPLSELCFWMPYPKAPKRKEGE